MGKRKTAPGKTSSNTPDLFTSLGNRRRRALILPRFLVDEAAKAHLEGDEQDRAFGILKHWADLEKQGHLNTKETALDAGYLEKVFGDALGYKTLTESPEKYQLERNFSVPGVGTADGALGQFASGRPPKPFVVIELKGASADLDRDKFNGRTAVQQCWDYLNALPECPWGVVSNFVTTRLYHRDKSPFAYQEFSLQDLRKTATFPQFYCLFASGAFIPGHAGQQPRALRLLQSTTERQREVGNELYDAYSSNRHRLIEHLCADHHKSLNGAIHIAQKILDRIIFIAFCEDRGLLPENCLKSTHADIPRITRVTNPRWRNFVELFGAIDKGVAKDPFLDTGYNGGLFRHDDEVDGLKLDDSWTDFFKTIGTYDFRDEVNVDVLGHLFEKSVGELEQVRVSGLFGTSGTANKSAMPKSAERKRFGI